MPDHRKAASTSSSAVALSRFFPTFPKLRLGPTISPYYWHSSWDGLSPPSFRVPTHRSTNSVAVIFPSRMAFRNSCHFANRFPSSGLAAITASSIFGSQFPLFDLVPGIPDSSPSSPFIPSEEILDLQRVSEFMRHGHHHPSSSSGSGLVLKRWEFTRSDDMSPLAGSLRIVAAWAPD